MERNLSQVVEPSSHSFVWIHIPGGGDPLPRL